MIWSILFFIVMIYVFGKLAIFGVKMAWGIAKFVCWILLLPIFLISLIFAGMFVIAVPILALVGLFTLLGTAT